MKYTFLPFLPVSHLLVLTDTIVTREEFAVEVVGYMKYDIGRSTVSRYLPPFPLVFSSFFLSFCKG